MSDDPSDEEIEARLLGVAAERWTALWQAVAELEAEAEHMTWGGGDVVDTTIVDGVERPVLHMPYAIYSEATLRMLRGLGGVGAITPFNWRAWDGTETYRGPHAFDDAPVADAVRMATAIVRADRFSEGTIGAMLNDGTLLAVVRRLRRWYDDERVVRRETPGGRG